MAAIQLYDTVSYPLKKAIRQYATGLVARVAEQDDKGRPSKVLVTDVLLKGGKVFATSELLVGPVYAAVRTPIALLTPDFERCMRSIHKGLVNNYSDQRVLLRKCLLEVDMLKQTPAGVVFGADVPVNRLRAMSLEDAVRIASALESIAAAEAADASSSTERAKVQTAGKGRDSFEIKEIHKRLSKAAAFWYNNGQTLEMAAHNLAERDAGRPFVTSFSSTAPNNDFVPLHADAASYYRVSELVCLPNSGGYGIAKCIIDYRADVLAKIGVARESLPPWVAPVAVWVPLEPGEIGSIPSHVGLTLEQFRQEKGYPQVPPEQLQRPVRAATAAADVGSSSSISSGKAGSSNKVVASTSSQSAAAAAAAPLKKPASKPIAKASSASSGVGNSSSSSSALAKPATIATGVAAGAFIPSALPSPAVSSVSSVGSSSSRPLVASALSASSSSSSSSAHHAVDSAALELDDTVLSAPQSAGGGAAMAGKKRPRDDKSAPSPTVSPAEAALRPDSRMSAMSSMTAGSIGAASAGSASTTYYHPSSASSSATMAAIESSINATLIPGLMEFDSEGAPHADADAGADERGVDTGSATSSSSSALSAAAIESAASSAPRNHLRPSPQDTNDDPFGSSSGASHLASAAGQVDSFMMGPVHEPPSAPTSGQLSAMAAVAAAAAAGGSSSSGALMSHLVLPVFPASRHSMDESGGSRNDSGSSGAGGAHGAPAKRFSFESNALIGVASAAPAAASAASSSASGRTAPPGISPLAAGSGSLSGAAAVAPTSGPPSNSSSNSKPSSATVSVGFSMPSTMAAKLQQLQRLQAAGGASSSSSSLGNNSSSAAAADAPSIPRIDTAAPASTASDGGSSASATSAATFPPPPGGAAPSAAVTPRVKSRRCKTDGYIYGSEAEAFCAYCASPRSFIPSRLLMRNNMPQQIEAFGPDQKVATLQARYCSHCSSEFAPADKFCDCGAVRRDIKVLSEALEIK